MPSGKGSKLLRYVEHRLRVTVADGRVITGTFLAFDKHLNLVLADTEEFRSQRCKKYGRVAAIEERHEKRNLGLIILRGENVVSIAVEGPPSQNIAGRLTPGGPGISVGTGRGVVVPNPSPVGVKAPIGLGPAPVHGVGGANNNIIGTGRGRGGSLGTYLRE